MSTADTTLPQLTAYPTNGQATDADLVFTFSEQVRAGSGAVTLRGEYGVVLFSTKVAGSAAITVTDNTLTLHLDQRLAFGTAYTIELSAGAVTDLAGNASLFSYQAFTSGLSPVALNLSGTDGADKLIGSDLADAISGGGGSDVIQGYGGNDLLNGGDETSPYDYYIGDNIHGGAGNDTINGNAGNDYLYGDEGDDALHGGDGNDQLYGGPGDNLLDGGDGNDALYGGPGRDTLQGGDGDDYLSAGIWSAASLDGGAGNDTLSGSDAASYDGGIGNDSIAIDIRSTVTLDSTAKGGDGDDVFDLSLISPARSHLVLSGDAGIDTYVLRNLSGRLDESGRVDVSDFTPGAGGDRIDVQPLLAWGYAGNPFGDGILRLIADGDDTLLQLKSATATTGYVTLLHLIGVEPKDLGADNFVAGIDPDGSPFSAPVTGTAGNDALAGALLNDSISGAGGNDTLSGAGGNDTLLGGAGNDYLVGGAGHDLLDGGDDGDTLYGGDGNDTLSGGLGNDTLDAGDGDNSLKGDAGDDQLYTTSTGASLLDGGAGNDTLFGGNGNDTLLGGDGKDVLNVSSYNAVSHDVTVSGGAGDDTLRFSSARDVNILASGGAGADTFVFNYFDSYYNNPTRPVTISDFVAAEGDLLDLRSLLFNNFSGNPFGSAGHLEAKQTGNDTTIWYDADGAAGAGVALPLVTLKNVTPDLLPASAFLGGFDITGTSKGLTLTGGAGDDLLAGTWLDDTIQGGDGRDGIDGGPGDDVLGGGDESVLGNGDTINGGLGNDTLDGGTGPDVLYGDGGNDSLMGGAGADSLTGGSGNDTLDGGAGDDVLSDGEGVNILSGGAGNDRLEAFTYYGTGHDSRLDGGTGDDTLVGGNANDTLSGGDGNDLIQVSSIYGSGTVTVDGGNGNDIIEVNGYYGNASASVEASGGAGSDTFRITSSYGTPVLRIADFQAGAGGDKLDMFQVVGWSGSSPFAGGSYQLVQRGADTVLQAHDSFHGADYFDLAVLKNIAMGTLTADNLMGYAPPVSVTPLPTPVPMPTPVPTPTPVPVTPPAPVGIIQTGGSGPDLLKGSAGNDQLIGGDGLDTAAYNGKRADYTVTRDAAGWHLADARGVDGSDTLQGVERVQFADGALALDIDGIAAQAYRFYRAAFDRVPDQPGLGYWISMMDQGQTVRQVAYGFATSKEFADLYGSAPANSAVLDLLYKNVLHRAPDAAGYAYWLDILDQKRADLPSVLAFFSESVENQDGTAQLIANGIAFAPWNG